jgi:hypothetical protein
MIGYIALSQFLEKNSHLLILFSNITHPIAAGLATCCLILAAARSVGRMRTAWGLMAAAMFSVTLADIIWGVLETSLGTPPFPSLADAFYLMFYPLFTLGIILMPVTLQSSGEIFTRGDRLTRLLDTGVVTIAASLIIWYFLISPNMEAGIEDRMTLALSAIYPVADMLLFFAIVQIIFQKTPINIQGSLIALAISGAILIIADSFFSIMSLQGTFVSGGMVDTAYIAGYTLIGLAGIMQARTPVLLKENRSLCNAAQKEIAERKQAVEAYHLLVDHSLQGLAIFRDGRIFC